MSTEAPQTEVPKALRADDEERTILVVLIAAASEGVAPTILPRVLQQVGPADYFDDLNRDSFSAFVKLYRDDTFTISRLIAALVERGHSPGAVTTFIRGLENDYTRTATIDYFCKVVADASARRKAIVAAEQTIRAASDKGVTREDLADIAQRPATILRGIDRASHRSTADLFREWEQGVLNRERPRLWAVAEPGSQLNNIPIGDGQVLLIGAPPGWGKTLLVNQLGFDALAIEGQEQLRLLIANVEMSPRSMLDRQLARFTGIGYGWIQRRDYDPEATPRLQAGIDQLREVISRVEFMRPPFILERLVDAATAHEANIVIVDYAQRFDSQRGCTDQRSRANAVMDCCRRIADEARAVIVVSAVSRPQSKTGKYEVASMGLASFRESSELEYGADAAFLLLRPDEDAPETVLKAVKNRAGARSDINLLFDGRNMKFTEAPVVGQEWEP